MPFITLPLNFINGHFTQILEMYYCERRNKINKICNVVCL